MLITQEQIKNEVPISKRSWLRYNKMCVIYIQRFKLSFLITTATNALKLFNLPGQYYC